MRSFLALVLATLCACGDDSPPTPDAGCSEPGTPPDQPAIGCPAEVDLGCIGASGAPLALDVSATACDGSAPVVVCTPADGDRVVPGTSSVGSCTATSPSGASAACSFAVRYRVDGAASIGCSDPAPVECEAALTSVTLPSPALMPSCDGGDISPPTDDAPEGFPVGSSTVTFTAAQSEGPALTCISTAVVTDTTPPTIDCGALARDVVRTEPDAPLASFIDALRATVVDRCDPAPSVEIAPLPTARGTTRVTATATDASGQAASCTGDITVLDVFAVTGLRVLSAAQRGASTDITLGWDASTGADVSGLRIERAPSATGPWTMLDVVAPSVQTFMDAELPGESAYYRVASLGMGSGGDEIEGGVTLPVRAFAISGDEYDLSGQAVPGVPFATSLFGVVRHPTDLGAGPAPLVLFMHGNHGNCRPSTGDDDCEERTEHACTDGRFTTTPNAHGYVYLQETLAARGYVTVSVSANALNCRPDFIPERTQLILEHLRRWAAWSSASGGGPFGMRFAGAVDMTRVALVGHSRGGEAVSGAPAALAATPIAGVALASVFAIGPTDYTEPTPTGVPFAVLLPGCDADVRTLEGLRQYDRGLSAPERHERAQVLYVGANHNFFNTEWRFDDNSGRTRVCGDADLVGAPAQRGMLEVTLPDWIEATAGSARLPDYVRADAMTPALMSTWAARPLDLRWSYSAADRLLTDDFGGAGAPNANDLGGTNEYVDPIASITCTGTCARNYPHPDSAVRLAWQDAPSAAHFDFAATDVSAYATLSMRFASRLATINDGVTNHDFAIQVQDAAGVMAEVSLSEHGRLAHGYPSNQEREVLSSVRVPLAALLEAAPTLDLTRITEVGLSMPIPEGNAAGSIWLDDLDFASD